MALMEPKAALDELGVTPGELAAAIALLRKNRADEDARADAARKMKATGYPKPLYNSTFTGESIAVPESLNRLNFHKGKIEVKNAEEERIVRAACPSRVFAADLPAEKQCKRCNNFITASTECWELHQESHIPN